MIRKDQHLRDIVKWSILDTASESPEDIYRFFQVVGVPSYELVERTMLASVNLAENGHKITFRNIAIQMVRDYGTDELIDDYIACNY